MAAAVEVERLVRELIATGTMWPETIADLERFVEDAKTGVLSFDDESYLVAFHAKCVTGIDPDRGGPEEAPLDDSLSANDWKLRAQDALRRAEVAEARVRELEAIIGSTGAEPRVRGGGEKRSSDE